VIFGTFRHGIFAGFHSKVAERGGDTVILVRDDGAVLARHPQQPAAFEAALLNLALNARDAMPRGGCIRLRVTAGWPAPAAGGPPQRHATIAIIDAGIGMDAATLARVAELLFTTKPPGLGTGLGLALVQGFALASGGTMRLQGAGPAQGASATLLLPEAPG
jgi:signal transduction histidine kinase